MVEYLCYTHPQFAVLYGLQSKAYFLKQSDFLFTLGA
jgi:hypothetical protein